MRQLSLLAIVLGLAAGLVVAAVEILMLTAGVGIHTGIDITDVRKNGEVVRLARIQLPLVAAWILAVLGAGLVAARVARRAPGLHGGVIGGIALLAALAGISRNDPAWAIALQLVVTVPAALIGACLRRASGTGFARGWGLGLAVVVFWLASVVLAAGTGDARTWTVFGVTAALVVVGIARRFRGNVRVVAAQT